MHPINKQFKQAARKANALAHSTGYNHVAWFDRPERRWRVSLNHGLQTPSRLYIATRQKDNLYFAFNGYAL